MTNRRQRRAETSVTGRPKSVSATNRAEAEYYKSLGVSLKDAGKDAEALPHLRQALALDPSQADVHFMIAVMDRTHPQLGIDIGSFNKSIRDKKPLIAGYKTMVDVFRQHKRYTEALFCQEELCRLNPSEPQALMDYGLLLNLTGDVEKGAVLLSRSFNLAPGNQYAKGIYSTSLYVTEFAAFHPEVKQAMTRCFDQLYDVNLSRMGAVWVGLMRREPAFAGLFAALDSDDFDAWADSLDETTGAFLKDPYFTRGLRVLVVNDHAVEILLTRLRRYICLAFDTLAANGRIRLFETFLYALAEQCFFNEYVYAQDEAEARAADALAGRGDRAALALLACYRPLYLALPDSADTLHALARKDPDLAHLVKPVDDPVEEAIRPHPRSPSARCPTRVSQAVRGQYEENPYPRWTTIITRPMPNDDLIVPESQRDLPFDILVAGCGTGRQAISAAIRGPKSRVTAIDLSRASLAYGLRKARETKLAHRVTFTHGGHPVDERLAGDVRHHRMHRRPAPYGRPLPRLADPGRPPQARRLHEDRPVQRGRAPARRRRPRVHRRPGLSLDR